jgi:oxygen-independent coproporphyrinogen-3 oxidase
MQEACQARLADAGFAQYEISAYARAGRQCRHNLNYWRFGDYLGIGAGAHGKLTLGATQQVLRRWKLKHPTDYLAKAGTAAAIGGDEYLTAQRLPFDFMLNALRLNEGVPMAMFEARTGLPAAAIADRVALARIRGWLEPDPAWLRPTELGRRFANDVIGLFLD